MQPAAAASSATPVQAPGNEPPVPGLERRDAGTLAVTLAATAAQAPLLLYGFEFEGEPVRTDKLHVKQLAPGVVEITSLAFEVGEWRVRIRDSAAYYGLGERFDTLNHARTLIKNAAQDNPGAKGSSTSKPIPFFMSTTGYGLWFDTTGDATFDMNASSSTEIVVDAAAEKLRLVLFTASEFPKILDAFTALAGRSTLPPYWAFAPWLGRGDLENQAQAAEIIDRARSLGLPASVVLLEASWTAGANGITFNASSLNDVPAMAKHIHDQGAKLLLSQAPWICNQSSNKIETASAAPSKSDAESSLYADAATAGYFVKDTTGAPYIEHYAQHGDKSDASLIDFTNQHAKLWNQEQVRQVIHAGVDGFEDNGGEGDFLAAVRFADTTDPRLMRNRYAVLYNNAMQERLQKDLKGNGVLLIRSITTGANGLGVMHSAETEASFSAENGLPAAILAGLNAGMSGMPLWTADLGGYEKSAAMPDARLFERWAEFAALSPIMETRSAADLLPWDYGDEALATYRKFALLHMSLFPYRYAAAQEAAKTGMPLMRALALAYQSDARAREAKDEYLFGPDLLVAPIVNEGTQRPVYLPAGLWIDYWTGASIAGGKTLLVDAPPDRIPLYVRQGAVIPKLPDDVMTLVPQSESGNTTIPSMDDRRVYEIFGEILGDTAAETTSALTRTDFEGRTVTRSGNTLTIAGESVAHILVRWKFARVQSVTVNGAPVKLQNTAGEPFVEFDHTGTSTVAWQ
jgi:alpha-D-xyloside xylohydrolase